MFGKSQNLGFECLEKPKFRIPMFGKDEIQNSIVWKKPEFRIPMC